MATHCPKCNTENPDTASFCADCGTQLIASDGQEVSFTKTLLTPVKDLTQGTLFADRYEIIEELGKGGMGKVYKALDNEIHEEVAIKLLKPEIAADEKIIERFRNELKIARGIAHKNVCKVYHFGKEEETPYITMEYVAGEDLKSRIQEKERLKEEEAISLAKQVCEGLAEAHRLGVIHRDLKPQNIMFDQEGQAKIMDFGIARSVEAPGVTTTGMIIGTPDYISPEQAEGEEADQRSDIYSLGVILYEMVTGSVPFRGDTALSVALKHKAQLPQDPKKLNADVSENLSRLILICMEKDRGRRYQTAEAVFNDLQNIEEGLPLGTKIQPRRATFTQSLIQKRLFYPALIVTLAIIAIAIWQLLPQGEAVIAPKIENSIAVISFENLTKEEVSDDYQKMIPNLLITSLEQTDLFHVATWERMRDLLKQIDKGDVDIITSDLGFQACHREGIKALALGSYAKVGETFVIDVKVLDVETKRLLKTASSRGEGENSIFGQIDELSKNISESMGMSLQKIEAAKLNISEVTTTSLEAYKYFIKGKEDYWKVYMEKAQESLEKAVILDPEFATAYLYLAYILFGKASNEAYEKAKTHSEKATEKERLYIEAAYAGVIERDSEKRLRIIKQITNKYPKEKLAYYLLGYYYFNTGNLDKALEEHNKALELDPGFGFSLNMIAYTYFAMENYEKAIEYFKKYVAISPGEPNPLDSMADAYFHMGRFEESVAKYKEALEVNPEWGNSYMVISYINALHEDYSEAMKWADQGIAIARDPQHEKGYTLLLKGFYYFWLGSLDQSLREIRSVWVLAESEGPDHMRYNADMLAGWVYYEKGEHELARKSMKNYFDFRITFRPTAECKLIENITLGQVDIKEGRYESVKARLVEMKSLLPEITTGSRIGYEKFYDLLHAEVLLAEGSFEEAVAVGKKLTFTIPRQHMSDRIILANVNTFSDVLARVYRQKGELDKAIAEYERLMTFDPESDDRRLIHPLYHYRLAKLYEEKGWPGKAIEQYEKFLEIWRDADPGIAEVDDAREKMTELKFSLLLVLRKIGLEK